LTRKSLELRNELEPMKANLKLLNVSDNIYYVSSLVGATPRSRNRPSCARVARKGRRLTLAIRSVGMAEELLCPKFGRAHFQQTDRGRPGDQTPTGHLAYDNHRGSFRLMTRQRSAPRTAPPVLVRTSSMSVARSAPSVTASTSCSSSMDTLTAKAAAATRRRRCDRVREARKKPRGTVIEMLSQKDGRCTDRNGVRFTESCQGVIHKGSNVTTNGKKVTAINPPRYAVQSMRQIAFRRPERRDVNPTAAMATMVSGTIVVSADMATGAGVGWIIAF